MILYMILICLVESRFLNYWFEHTVSSVFNSLVSQMSELKTLQKMGMNRGRRQY